MTDETDTDDLPELTPAQRRSYERFHTGRNPLMAQMLSRIMTKIGFSRFCRLGVCKRARACASPKAECASRHKASVERYILPDLRRLLQARLASLNSAPAPEQNAPRPAPLRRARAML